MINENRVKVATLEMLEQAIGEKVTDNLDPLADNNLFYRDADLEAINDALEDEDQDAERITVYSYDYELFAVFN